jgi:O-methyltransferase
MRGARRAMLVGLAGGVRRVVARQIARVQYRTLFAKYREFTMVSPGAFAANCAVAAGQVSVEGCVIECGVWRGGMSAALAEIMGPERPYYLLDSFEGLPPATAKDGAAAVEWQRSKASPWYHDNCRAEQSYARRAMALSPARRVEYVQGWFEETLPSFKPTAPIALLRLDADWYDSTKVCLRHLMPSMAPNGVVLVDDYYSWEGCARAIHEFLASEDGNGWRVVQRDNSVCALRRFKK